MRIALLTDTYFPQINGVARVVSTSAEALRKQGHEVVVFSVYDSFSIPLWGYPGERVALPTTRIYKKVLAFKPDIIHAHTPFLIGWNAFLIARKLKIPLVGTHHTFFEQYLKHLHLDFAFMKYLTWKYTIGYYNRCDIILCPSTALLKGMKSYGMTKESLHFANAVNTNFFTPATETEKGDAKKHFNVSGPALIYMGRLSYEKSIDQVIKAFKLVHDARPDTTLLIVGGGPETKNLKELARKLDLSSSIIFTGMLHEKKLLQALHASDVFITASKTENMPVSVLEAMSTGLPAIGVDALGMPEVIRNSQNGFILPPDDVQGMADTCLILLEQKDLREQFSDESRNIALQFGVEENARKLEEVYKSVLK